MKFIGPMCLCKCKNVCLHKRHECKGIDVTTMASPFQIILCALCWGYRLVEHDHE